MCCCTVCLIQQEPSSLDAAGRPCVKFGKLTVPGQSRQLPISVRNNGYLAATARIELDHNPAFKLLQGTQVLMHVVGCQTLRAVAQTATA